MPTQPLHIWLLQDGEPLPTDDNPRLMRTGRLAQTLVDDGCDVTWWTSNFNHSLKKPRNLPRRRYRVDNGYHLYALDGPSYDTNLSLSRIRHYRALGAGFTEDAQRVKSPDLILGSLPSPDLCLAGLRFATERRVPFVVDIRDPWPDIFHQYVPSVARVAIWPLIQYYRRQVRAIMGEADGIVAVSEAMLDWGTGYARRRRRGRDAVFFIGYNQPAVARPIHVPGQFTDAEPLICLFATTCGNSYDGSTVVEAARLLESSGERRARFVISGDGERRQSWIDQAAGLTTVQFTGWISHEELQEHFCRAHIGLILLKGGITPFWLGNKFGEYLSTSLGLVNNVPGEASKLVTTHRLGVNVNVKDSESLARAVQGFLASPTSVREAMQNSSRLFAEQFERTRIYKRYSEYLRDIACG